MGQDQFLKQISVIALALYGFLQLFFIVRFSWKPYFFTFALCFVLYFKNNCMSLNKKKW